MTLDLRPLDPSQLDAWLGFFDGPAFADNRDWGGCYCRCFLAGGCDWAAWDAACADGSNRADMTARIAAGEVDGVLARDGDDVVGWVHFGPAERFRPPGYPPPEVRPGVARIVCFVVAASHRRQGVARALLQSAVRVVRDLGFTTVEARPRANADHPAMELFTGPLPLYLSEGFEVVATDGPNVTVRRPL